jgi:hypothetical protein
MKEIVGKNNWIPDSEGSYPLTCPSTATENPIGRNEDGYMLSH